MTRSTGVAAMVAAALASALVSAQQSSGGDVALRAAVEAETVRGDVQGAIDQYARVAATYATSDRAVAAQAQLRLAELYQKLNDPQARRVYEEIVRDYGAQPEAVTARARLTTFQEAAASTERRLAVRKVFDGEGIPGGINGSVSPDGRWVSFTDWVSGGIAVRDLASGANRVLARPTGDEAYAEGSIFSADGRQVAYLWVIERDRVSGRGGEFQVRTVSLDANAEPRIVHRSPRYMFVHGWSPDGREVLLTRVMDDNTWQIAMVNIQNGSIRALESQSWAAIGASLSPDGRYVAYDAPAADGARDIFVLATNESHKATIVQHPADDHSTIWSQDGSRIMFVSNRTPTPSLWSVKVNDGRVAGEAELIRAEVGTPLAMSRTGTLYYKSAGATGRNVYRVPLGTDGSAAGVPEPVGRSLNTNWGVSVSHDGHQLAYYSRRPDRVLVIYDLASDRERIYSPRITIDSPFENGPGWLPDGRSVIIEGSEPGRQGRLLYRVDLASGDLSQIAPTLGGNFKISLDGTFALMRGAASNLLGVPRLDLTTREVSIIDTEGDDSPGSPAISRDGRRIAYVRWQPMRIAIADVSGRGERIVYQYPEGVEPPHNTLAWSADDRYVLFTVHELGRRASIWRVPVAGGDAEPMDVSMRARINGPQIHPNGQSLFFSGLDDRSEIWALENFLPPAR